METVWIIAYIIVVVVALSFIFLYFRSLVVLVPPSACGASFGLYSVDPGKSADTLATCGGTGNENCIFHPLTLNEAITLCDQDSGRCQAFFYSEVTRNMTYLVPTSATFDTNLGGIYRRKVNPVQLQT
jgi:hypothetical protein